MSSQPGFEGSSDQVFDFHQEVGLLQQFSERSAVICDHIGNTKEFFTGLRMSSHIYEAYFSTRPDCQFYGLLAD